jgi:hypothetical protein
MSNVLREIRIANHVETQHFGDCGKLEMRTVRRLAIPTCMGVCLDSAIFAGLAKGDSKEDQLPERNSLVEESRGVSPEIEAVSYT